MAIEDCAFIPGFRTILNYFREQRHDTVAMPKPKAVQPNPLQAGTLHGGFDPLVVHPIKSGVPESDREVGPTHRCRADRTGVDRLFILFPNAIIRPVPLTARLLVCSSENAKGGAGSQIGQTAGRGNPAIRRM
jgi:hypothetical protein